MHIINIILIRGAEVHHYAGELAKSGIKGQQGAGNDTGEILHSGR